jgi:two-component system response regulator YesN
MKKGRETLAEEIVAYVDEHWASRVSLKELAACFCVEEAEIARTFRMATGITFHCYLDQLRKDKFLDLIGDNTLHGYQIGNQLGFAHDLAFYRWVKRVYGVPFSALRTNGIEVEDG